jgi:hypothetical protein
MVTNLIAVTVFCVTQYSDCRDGQCALPQQPAGLFNAVSPEGRPLIGSTQYRSTQPAKANQTFGWHTRNAIRQYSNPQLGVLLSDIEANMPAQHEYKANDRITWAHETIHGISSSLRIELGEGINGFYIPGKGVAMVLREPNMKKVVVNRFVPQELRGDLWTTYMDNPQVNAGMTGAQSGGAMVAGWERQPLYILDELNAYIGGMEVAQELRARGLPLGDDGNPGERAWKRDLTHAIEFCGYATALVKAVKDFDPSYPDLKNLESFVTHAQQRTAKLVQTIGEPEHKTHLQQYLAWAGAKGLEANPQYVARAKPQNVLTIEQRLDRIEQQLELLAKGVK